MLRKIKRKIKSKYIRKFGLGYVKRKITGGPLNGLYFIAGKRVHYSKWFWDGSYEEDCCKFLCDIVPVGAVCYDIGANLGYHTLIMARKAGNDGIVYAFEPIRNVLEILDQNIQINHIQNVVNIEKVVCKESGTATLVRHIGIDQAAISEKKMNPLLQTITCPAITIDEFVSADNRPPSFIKIDVEGAEESVLESATETLSQYHPMILCETHGVLQAQNVYEILLALDYALFRVDSQLSPIESVEQVPTNMNEGHLFARQK